MEIRSIELNETRDGNLKYELTVGNVSKAARQEASELTGFDFPRLYLEMLYDKETGNVKLVEHSDNDKPYVLYTRGREGVIHPIDYHISPNTVLSLSKIISMLAKGDNK